MEQIIVAGILILVSVFAFMISIRSFMEKGFLLNNAFFYASKEERETMNKKIHYRQGAIVFLSIGLIFLLTGLNMLFLINWIFNIVIVIVVVTLIYAIVSSVMIEKNKKQQ